MMKIYGIAGPQSRYLLVMVKSTHVTIGSPPEKHSNPP